MRISGWSSDVCSSDLGLPGEEYFLDFDKDQVGLQPVHIGEWSDLIFVNFAEEPSKTLEQFLGELVDDFRGYFSPEQWQPVRRYHWTLDFNWKLYLDRKSTRLNSSH